MGYLVLDLFTKCFMADNDWCYKLKGSNSHVIPTKLAGNEKKKLVSC